MPARQRRALLAWGAIVALSLGALWAFSEIADEVLEGEAATFDSWIRERVIALRSPAADRAFRVVTHAGSTTAMVPLAMLVGFLLWRPGRRRISATIVTAPAVASGSFVGLKALLQRPRPDGATAFDLTTYAFPSGHATVSTAVIVTVCYVLARERLLPWAVALPGAFVVPLAVGFSRIYLDVHWSTDVLAGWALGLVCAGIAAGAYEWLRRPNGPEEAVESGR